LRLCLVDGLNERCRIDAGLDGYLESVARIWRLPVPCSLAYSPRMSRVLSQAP
jgi:hypothetical protein